jgi:hypothetical protein
MGRVGLLAVAVVLGFTSSAFAEAHRCNTSLPSDDHLIQGPPPPTEAVFGLGAARPGGGREITTIAFSGTFGPSVAHVKLTMLDMSGELTPTQVVVLDPTDSEPCDLDVAFTGIVVVVIEAIDADGHVGWPHFTAARAPTLRAGCGLGATMMAAFEWFFVIGLFAIISFVAIMRRIRRGTNGEVPIVISLVLAETLARRARSHDGIVAALAIAGGIVAWTMYGNWVVIGSVWILLCVGDYWVATHAVSILERPQAVAELYGTNLVVRAEDHTSAILLSRRAIKRAKRDALPRALLQ